MLRIGYEGYPRPLICSKLFVMSESALAAFASFFATVGPPDVAVVFAALTPNNTSSERLAALKRNSIVEVSI